MNTNDIDVMFNATPDDNFDELWNSTEAAPETRPLPKGTYKVLIIKGVVCESRTGTRGFRITFRVEEGEYAGRVFWQTAWLSERAMPYAKRDLLKLGITSPAQLSAPYPPPGMRVHAHANVVLRKDDDGSERNEVRNFEVLSHEEEPKDEFAPRDDELAGGAGES
jgi:hypothetical protein